MPPRKPQVAYSEQIAAVLCDRIADGASLRSVCRSDDMPSRKAVFLWLAKYPDFALRYSTAMEERAEHHFDEMFEVADGATPENERVARLRVDVRKWALARMHPRKYGDRVGLEHSGPQGRTVPLKVDLPDELRDELAALARRAARR